MTRCDDPEPFHRNGSAAFTETKLFSEQDSHGLTFRWVMKMAGEAALSRPYAQHPWVHACVSAIGKATSSVPLVLQRQSTDGAAEPVESGPLFDLFSRPNKLMSQRKFLTSLTQTQQLYGETMLLMMEKKPNGQVSYIEPSDQIRVPDELWPVRGDLLEEIIDEHTQLPRAWRMTTSKGTIEIPDQSLIHVAAANPYNPIRGMGPMQAAFRTAAKDFVLDRYDEALLQNSGSPGGILSVDGHLTDADQRAIADAWREAHGRPDSHRKTAVLPQGTKYEEIGFSPQEMEFQQMRAWNRETIMAIFGVTKPIIGLTEGLNYASSQSAFRSFWEVTVMPFLDFIADELQTKFIDRLVGPESDYTVAFDTSGVAALREDADSKVERTLKLFGQGGRTFNEAADLAGWDIGDTELENADEAYMPSSMIPVGTGMPVEAPADSDLALPPEEEEEEEEEDVAEEAEERALTLERSPACRLNSESSAECVSRKVPEILRENPGMDQEQAVAIAASMCAEACSADVEQADAQLKYWQAWDRDIQRHEAGIARTSKRILREMLLQMRRRLREAADGPWAKGAPSSPAYKHIATEAEIARLLDMNAEAWGAEMLAALDPKLTALIVDSAIQAQGDLGGGAAILSRTDPVVVRYMASKELVLSNITTNVIEEVQRAIVRIMATEGVEYASLREAIWHTLAESEAYINGRLKGLGTRAQLIARTETTGAANFGRLEQFRKEGVMSSIWYAQPSARESHAELSGREAKAGEEFGFGLRYPGDPNADVSQIANCRCLLLPGKDRT